MPATARLSPVGAQKFVDRYRTFLTDTTKDKNRRDERAVAQRFWDDFFLMVCGVGDTLLAGIEYQYPVRKASTDSTGWIDALWPGVVLIEHKSAGKDLGAAEVQARDYLAGLGRRQRPPVIIVSDFFRFRVVEALTNRSIEFTLDELPEHLASFQAILSDGGVGAAHQEEAADAKAAELMADLYIAFQSAGYDGHEVSVFLVRCLFLLFGDDTGLWRAAGELGLFGSIVADSNEDGSGLGGSIQELFEALDTPKDQRPRTTPHVVAEFPYVNGGLFASESLHRIFSFSAEMRNALLAACAYDWSSISPQIFGAMFQTIKDKDARRALGEHYTSEQNIMKVIGPLFLDAFVERVDREWDSPAGLRRFQKELATYTWLDPACGCGNFLLVAYKSLRELELKVAARIQELEGTIGRAILGEQLLHLRLSQFHGIEMVEWSSQIAQVALLLAEHQANIDMERVLGLAPKLLPISEVASIRHADALEVDWAEGTPMNERTFIMGNPPFVGHLLASPGQKEAQSRVWDGIQGEGVLDFVTNWFLIAARHAAASGAHAAFVATNSIAQGEQPAVLWKTLDGLGMSIDFAHQAFRWTNGTREQAAVHTVIIGFSKGGRRGSRALFTYQNLDAQPVRTDAKNINAYLLNGPQVIISSRTKPLVAGVPPMVFGNMPNDGGHLSKISATEAEAIRKVDPIAARYLRPLVGADEVLNGGDRWCVWLAGASPADLRSSPELRRRIEAVKEYREKSTRKVTREGASRSWEFMEIRHPQRRYLAVPRHSSEHRRYLAAALYEPHIICNDAVSIVVDPPMEQVGLLFSHIFWVWTLAVSGRIKSDPRISSKVTYNNFPWPDLTQAQATAIADAATGVLTARSLFAEGTLADLYDPLTMPKQLRQAHDQLDREVAKVFGLKPDASDAAILQKLFENYLALTSGPLFPTTPRATRRRAA